MPLLKDELSGFVPVETSKEIIKNVARGSSILRLAKTVPMTSDKQKVPVMTDGVGAYWVGEGERIKTSKPTWIFPELVAKKLAVIIPMTKEKLEDAVMDVLGELAETTSEAFYQAIMLQVFLEQTLPLQQTFLNRLKQQSRWWYEVPMHHLT